MEDNEQQCRCWWEAPLCAAGGAGTPWGGTGPLRSPCCGRTVIVGSQSLQCRWKWNLCNTKFVSHKLEEELSSLQVRGKANVSIAKDPTVRLLQPAQTKYGDAL